MNIYHITYTPATKTANLHFWGCNFKCLGCIRRKEVFDCHLDDKAKAGFTIEAGKDLLTPTLLSLEQVMETLESLDVKVTIFMGAEPTTDPELPRLARTLHQQFHSHNTLLTNGFEIPDLKEIDEVAFSIKAYEEDLHRHYTGRSNKQVLENFVVVYRSGVKLRAESVFIPEYIDIREIEAIARFIASVNEDIPYRLDAYIPVAPNPWRRPLTEEIDEAVSVAKKHLRNVSALKGGDRLKFAVVRVV